MKLVFRVHAVRRMAQRRISPADVRLILQSGEIIEDYLDDFPYPSKLILGFVNQRPIHVVAAYNSANQETIIVTAYEPDASKWDDSFRKRTNS